LANAVSFREEKGEAMKVTIITYNMGMGVSDRDDRPIIESRDEAFDVFADKFSQAYLENQQTSEPSAAWFICVQEIFRNYDGNQVEELQAKLEEKTKVSWYKNSNTRPDSKYDEAVAVFSTIERDKEQKWSLPGGRVAQAYKAEIASGKYLWVVTTHLIKGGDDTDGEKRKESIEIILQNLATFDGTVPIVLCGDMNVTDPTPGTYNDREPDTGLFNQTIGKVARFGFTRGAGFSPKSTDITFHAWNDPPAACTSGEWSIIDYIQVNETGKCTAQAPAIINYTSRENCDCNSKNCFASDHKGLQMEIDYP
jgi:endonuclease/exonuclease/phosphatase family metal-dependent hydrolase